MGSRTVAKQNGSIIGSGSDNARIPHVYKFRRWLEYRNWYTRVSDGVIIEGEAYLFQGPVVLDGGGGSADRWSLLPASEGVGAG